MFPFPANPFDPHPQVARSTAPLAALDSTALLAALDPLLIQTRTAPLAALDSTALLAALDPLLIQTSTASSSAPLRPRSLLVQGRTFEQWREQLLTELDPTIRAEAFRAFALFGANGRGKDATEAIIDAVKGFRFSISDPFPGTEPINIMKHAAVQAFASESVRIPFEVSLPILTEKLANGNENEQSFAQVVFRRSFATFDDEMALKFVKEAIQNNEMDRFQLFFSVFRNRATSGTSTWVGVPLGITPHVAASGGVSNTRTGQRIPENPRLTPFGHSLLTLLQEEGLRSENELIRTTSQQVVDALTQIAELE